MSRGNRNNNASGQQHTGAISAGSSSGKSAFKPVRDGAGKNKKAAVSSSGSSRNNGSSSGSSRNNGSSSGNSRNNGSSSGNSRNSGSSSGNSRNRNNGSSSQSRRDDDDGKHVPGTNVVRTMRTVLPAHAKISDDAKEAVQECVSEYISLITSEANERCVREHRKTLTPEDLLYGMAKLGFDSYIQPLTLYLNRYRASESARSTVSGEPTVYRAVNYPHLLQEPPPPSPPQHAPPLPPPPPPSPSVPAPTYFNPQVALPPPPPPPSFYFINPTADGIRGFRVAIPTSTADVAGPSTSSVANYAPDGVYNLYSAACPRPLPPGGDPSRQFFK